MRRCTLVGLAVAVLVAASSAGAPAANRWPVSRVTAAPLPTGLGAWLVRANGAVTAYGEAAFHGDARQVPLAQPIKGIASTATGKGYWLAASDGGVFSYGDARFHGSMAGTRLNAPVVAIAATKDGHGYWLAASDGGVFAFGDARFLGSLAGRHLDQPIIGITASPSGNGYRLLARDGGVFTFGDAPFEGSLGGRGINDVVGLAPTRSGSGYWLLRRLGGTYRRCNIQFCSPGEVPGPIVFNFGDARGRGEPAFFSSCCEQRPVVDPDVDFVGNPVVAIVSNLGTRGFGYAVFRARGTAIGVGGLP